MYFGKIQEDSNMTKDDLQRVIRANIEALKILAVCTHTTKKGNQSLDCSGGRANHLVYLHHFIQLLGGPGEGP